MSSCVIETHKCYKRPTAYKVLAVSAIAIQLLAITVLVDFPSYGLMAAISITQLVFLFAVVAACPGRQTFGLLFLMANWIFNCGHFICIAVGADESINLDFRLYGGLVEYTAAFMFYLFSQSLIALGIILFRREIGVDTDRRDINYSIAGTNKIGAILAIVGLPFRLYVDCFRFAGALSSGYEGVYSLVIPAPIQAAAFFFDAGVLMLLLLYAKEKKGAVLFWAVLIYKIVSMSTGARQEALCYIVVWCLLYFGYLRKVSLRRIVILAVSGVILLLFVDAFGEMRTAGFSLEAFARYFADVSFLDVIWDSLGEFGCAFSTLVVSVADVPSLIDYGLGKSYIAGALSVVPTLVNNFPDLKAATLFTQMLPNTSFFGGSMLGEFYYNFGWFGLVGAFLTGGLVAFCQNRLGSASKCKDVASIWIAAILSTFLLLFIRGYFTDFIMKFAYVLLFTWVAASYFKGKECALSRAESNSLERG